MALNIFNPPRKDDIKVAYIDPTLGLVRDVSICDANIEAQKNPGTIFIFRDGNQTLKYLNINEVNALNPNDLVPTEECGGITSKKECGPPTIQIFGGGGIGAAGNAVISPTGAVLAVDVIRGGNGYQYPPLASVKDLCASGSGAVLLATIGNIPKKNETPDPQNLEICPSTRVGYGKNWGPNGEDLGDWDPKTYFPEEYSSGSSSSFEAGVFTPSNPRNVRIGASRRTTYDLKYKLSIPGYTSKDLVNVTWNITGQGDIGRGFRFTFTAIDKSHSFVITEAVRNPRNRGAKVEKHGVKPNIDYNVVTSSIGGVAGPARPVVQQGTLSGGPLNLDQLFNASPTPGQASNAAFADALGTRSDSDDMRIVAFDVELPPAVPEDGVERGVVKKIIVIDPGNGYIPPNFPSPVPPVIVAIPPGPPGIGIGTIGIGITPGTTTGTTPGTTPGTTLGTIPGTIPGTTPGTTLGTTLGTTPPILPPIPPPIPPSGPPTGINATFLPQFEVVRDPIVIDPQKLLQVTDLVGLKQTGYVNGRAYYGSVYYNRGIRYAGFYETVGEPVIVYDTLRESILAQITTPPSAILRQGTDIRSNDPLLNIPRTIQPTLNSNSIVGAGDYFPPSVPFTQEPTPGAIYSVSLRLSEVLVTDPGINYNVTDKIRITPSNGAILEPVFGSFGRVIKVSVIDPGFGFTEYPQIEMYTPL